jgi:pimeloyl-ACP methyl ester carboxylesterase
VGDVARRLAIRWPELNHRLYLWQVGRFIQDPALREEYVPLLYREFESSIPAFFRLNQDLLPTVINRRRRLPQLRQFRRPVRIAFGIRDRNLNPRVALQFAELFPHSQLRLIDHAGHYVQVDQPERVAETILA